MKFSIFQNKQTGEQVLVNTATGDVFGRGLGNIFNSINNLDLSAFSQQQPQQQQSGGFFQKAGNFFTNIWQKPDGSATTFQNLFNKVADNVSFDGRNVTVNTPQGQQQVGFQDGKFVILPVNHGGGFSSGSGAPVNAGVNTNTMLIIGGVLLVSLLAVALVK